MEQNLQNYPRKGQQMQNNEKFQLNPQNYVKMREKFVELHKTRLTEAHQLRKNEAKRSN